MIPELFQKMKKQVKTFVFKNALDIICHLPVSPYTIMENTLWNLLHDRIALFTFTSTSQKEYGKELSKVISGKERGNNSHVTRVTQYSVY